MSGDFNPSEGIAISPSNALVRYGPILGLLSSSSRDGLMRFLKTLRKMPSPMVKMPTPEVV